MTRVKSNAVAYAPAPRKKGRKTRGRPKTYGKKIKLKSLLANVESMQKVASPVYGEDARRYRVNAAECLLAAKTCEPFYRSGILAISAAWYALAIEDEEIVSLFATWSEPAPVQEPATAEI